MALSDAQHRVHKWISQFEEGYFHPLTNLARLTEEVGELAREINHRFGQKTKKTAEPEGDLGMEMADIVFVLICIANREGIDLEAAFDRMMTKVETRDDARWTKKAGVRRQEGGGRSEETIDRYSCLPTPASCLYSQAFGAVTSSFSRIR